MAYDCFLSYASKDLAQAEAVDARLTAAGFTVWFDKARLQHGCDWHKEIEECCETSRDVLPLLTPCWKQSEWTRYETYGAEAVIPLLVEGQWPDVSTPPLTPYQDFCVPLVSTTDADWLRLFDSIRKFCAREAPQKQERVHRLRYHPAKHFVGREKDLDEIHEKLFLNPTAALTQGHVQAIAAMGGVGKTTLARQYAEKFWRCYPQMFWADCRLGLETEFAAIHDILRPEPLYAALSSKDKAGWVRFEFSQSANRPRRLLILDNADDEESVLEWIPKTGNCHTLITSRFTGWSSGIETYRVWVLEPEPARALLLRRSGRADTPAGREVCDAVAKKLEYLPVALEQAAAYVGEQPQGWGFAEYLRLYEANERAFLMEKMPGATEYPDSVYLTWRATIDKLPQGARAILRLHAFLASTPTPVTMFVRGVEHVAEEAKVIRGEAGSPADGDIEGAGEFAVRKWVSSLAKYSMAQLQPNDSFSVHGLVHAVERHAIGERRAKVLEATRALLVRYAPDETAENPTTWPVWDRLRPHAEALVALARADSRVEPDLQLIIALGQLYYGQGLYQHGLRIDEAALDLAERVDGLDSALPSDIQSGSLSFASRLVAYGETLRVAGRYAEAEAAFRKSLAISEKLEGPRSLPVASDLNYVALAIAEQGNAEESAALLRRALEIYESEPSADKNGLKKVLTNLGSRLADRGEFDGAERLLRRALLLSEESYGSGHPRTLLSMNNLAAVYHMRGDYDAADPPYRQAASVSEDVLGADHPQTLGIVANLASVLGNKGRFDAAEPLYRRTLEARERLLGPEHPDTLGSVNGLAYILNSKGNYAAAEPLYQRALETSERVLGLEHPFTLLSVNNLAGVLSKKGDYAAAEPLYRRGLGAREQVLGPGHRDTLVTLLNLTDLLAKAGRPDEAAALRKEYIRRMVANETSATPLALRQLAGECFQVDDHSRAEQLLRRVLKESFELPGTHCHLARVLLMMDREKEALAEVNLVWEHRAEGPPYIPQRIHFLQALFDLLDGLPPTEALQNLKKELARPDAMMAWDLRRLLDHLKPRLTPEANKLIEALSAAINDRAATTHLETLPAWKAIP